MQTAITKNNDNDMLVKLYLKRPLLIRCLISLFNFEECKSNKSVVRLKWGGFTGP